MRVHLSSSHLVDIVFSESGVDAFPSLDQNAVTTLFASFMDQIPAAVADREILLKEVYHRVKNNLATVASLIRLGAEGVHDEKALAVFEDSCRRIESLALLHEELYGSASLSDLDFGKFLRSVTERIFSASAPSSRFRLRIETQCIPLPISSAIPLALIANELVSNALKHAFPAPMGGTVSVSIERESGSDTVILRVTDDGVGLPEGLDPERAGSLGFVLIHHLAQQIGGSVDHRGRPGTEFRIRFAAPQTASAAKAEAVVQA